MTFLQALWRPNQLQHKWGEKKRLIWKLKEEAQQNSSRHQLLRQARQQRHNLPITALFWCAWQYFRWFDSDWNVASRSEYFNKGMWHSLSSQRSRGHWAFAVLAFSRGHRQTTWRVFNRTLKHVIAYRIVSVVWSATLLFLDYSPLSSTNILAASFQLSVYPWASWHLAYWRTRVTSSRLSWWP